jgi:hypothetical protein
MSECAKALLASTEDYARTVQRTLADISGLIGSSMSCFGDNAPIDPPA